MPNFKLYSPFQPTGDQPDAINKLVANLKKEYPDQILLGVTGSGKTFTMANVINQIQKPTLVLAHNKTLAAQLFSEFREFFPDNSVQYFVSYYDYYQPEAYIPVSDTYIEKDSNINTEIEKFRHAATHAILTRSDTIIVSSVSCIYGLGSPEVYREANLKIKKGEQISRSSLSHRLVELQYERNDYQSLRGNFKIQGESITIFPAYEDLQIRLIQLGDEIEAIQYLDPLTAKVLDNLDEIEIYPAKHYLTPEEHITKEILGQIEHDLYKEVEAFKRAGKLLEAERLLQRVNFDLEMIGQTGTTSGIENYSRYFDRRQPSSPPSVLLDYFPKDFLLMVDESHISIPQIGGMYNGDQARKQTLVDYGFRLKAAKDNRPLTFAEFEARKGQTVYVSATPGKYELAKIQAQEQKIRLESGVKVSLVAEQLIRPTGIVDPEVIIRPIAGQIEDLQKEIELRLQNKQRTLVTTLTKRMAEDLTEYLQEKGIKVNYLHSDIKTIERSEILLKLRQGVYDVLVGINLLREGLDLPEVSLIAILDADKEGFLRSESALIQTIGRAARHLEGKVILYANNITGSMERAIGETNRRRLKQIQYNQEHHITPKSIIKEIKNSLPKIAELDNESYKSEYQKLSAKEKAFYLDQLREMMRQAALNLNYEEAAKIRDRIRELLD
jgi:excinuclease ABC subunit B